MKVSLRESFLPPTCTLCGRVFCASEGGWPEDAEMPSTRRYIIAPDGTQIPCGSTDHWSCARDKILSSGVMGPYINLRYSPEHETGPLIEAYLIDYAEGGFIEEATEAQWESLTSLLSELGFRPGGNVRFAIVDLPASDEPVEFSSPSDVLTWSTVHTASDGFFLDAVSWDYEHKGDLAKLSGATSFFHMDGLLTFEQWYPKFQALLASDPGAADAYERFKNSTKFLRKWGDDYAPYVIYHKSRDAGKKIRKTYRKTLPSAVERAVAMYHSGGGHAGWYQNAWAALKFTFGDEASLVADLLAATSPKMPIEKNVNLALDIYRLYKMEWNDEYIPTLEGKRKSKMPGSEGSGALWGSYLPNIYRAIRGEPLSGLKVWNFSRALKGDEDAAVIDTWMTKALFGVDHPDSITDRQYLFAEMLLESIADSVGKPVLFVTEEDLKDPGLEGELPQGLRPSLRKVQEHLWGDINPKPQTYHETLPTALEKQRKKHPEFWDKFGETAVESSLCKSLRRICL